jgi:hypothetical protein
MLFYIFYTNVEHWHVSVGHHDTHLILKVYEFLEDNPLILSSNQKPKNMSTDLYLT